MNVTDYFNNKCNYQKCLGKDDETNMEIYDTVKEVSCRIEGKTRYIRNTDNSLTVSEQTFWITEDVKVRDKINNQYIIGVSPIYNFDGSLIYNEAYL
jgi:hypothetical protein